MKFSTGPFLSVVHYVPSRVTLTAYAQEHGHTLFTQVWADVYCFCVLCTICCVLTIAIVLRKASKIGFLPGPVIYCNLFNLRTVSLQNFILLHILPTIILLHLFPNNILLHLLQNNILLHQYFHIQDFFSLIIFSLGLFISQTIF